MTIFVFGKGDELYLPRMTPLVNCFGSEVSYTRPSYDWCYSSWGFAVPVDYEGIPLSCWMDDNLPLTSFSIKRFPNSCSYILITHSGHAWKISVGAHENKKIEELENLVSQVYIHRDSESWWLGGGSIDLVIEVPILLGFLNMDPPREKIEEFWKKTFKAQELECLSIESIVKKLNEFYPQKDVKSVEDKPPSKTTQSIAKILSELID